MKKTIFAALTLLVALCATAQESRTGYNFLRLPVSARASALGGENITLIEDDASLIFSNPALLGTVSDKTVNLNYMNYMEGCNTASASYSRTVGDKATVAASGQFMDYGKMKETDATGTQTGEFSARDVSIGAYLAYQLADKLVGGITAKFISSSLASYNSLAMGVDLGLNYYNADADLSLSAVARNLGGQLKAYDNGYERMPLDLQLGATKRLRGSPLRLSATLTDMGHLDYKFIRHLRAGAELLLSQQIWVAMGYNFQRAHEMLIASNDTESAHGAGLTFGGGLQLERFKLSLSYSKLHVSSRSLIVNASFCL